jgi:hypothetical protein
MADEDDYFSDKFLIEAAAQSAPKTYSQRRQEALKRSRVKNEQNRQRSRRQREQESREEGLSKSLFERAQEEEVAAGGSKALGIMMKMGFKVGQTLGKTEDSPPNATVPLPGPSEDGSPQGTSRDRSESAVGEDSKGKSRHTAEPLPLNEWQGRSTLIAR